MASPDNTQPGAQGPQTPESPAVIPGTQQPAEGSILASVPEPQPKSERPAWSAWDVLVLALLAFVSIIVAQFSVTTIAHRFWFPNETWRDTLQQPVVIIIAQCLFYIPVALSMIGLIEGKYHIPFWRAVSWNWPSSVWKMLALGAAMLVVLTLLGNFFPAPKDTPFEHLFDRPTDAYILGFIAVTVAPLLEELFFRGLLYPVLAREWGVPWGVFLTALPFALLHLQQYGYAWVAFSAVLIVGIVCGIVRASTKSVGASFLVHVGYNGTEMLIMLLVTRGFTHMPKALAAILLK